MLASVQLISNRKDPEGSWRSSEINSRCWSSLFHPIFFNDLCGVLKQVEEFQMKQRLASSSFFCGLYVEWLNSKTVKQRSHWRNMSCPDDACHCVEFLFGEMGISLLQNKPRDQWGHCPPLPVTCHNGTSWQQWPDMEWWEAVQLPSEIEVLLCWSGFWTCTPLPVGIGGNGVIPGLLVVGRACCLADEILSSLSAKQQNISCFSLAATSGWGVLR